MMNWMKAGLLLTLMGCTELPLEEPNPPPVPPDADLWPLGGKIYHGTEIEDVPDVSTDAAATTPDAEEPPAQDAEGSEQGTPDAADDADSAEERAAEAAEPQPESNEDAPAATAPAADKPPESASTSGDDAAEPAAAEDAP
jgi:hypothetical protein